jgi:hypothetical protein
MWAPGTARGSARPEASARPKTRAHGCKQGHEHAAGMPSARAHDESGRKRNAHAPIALQHSQQRFAAWHERAAQPRRATARGHSRAQA